MPPRNGWDDYKKLVLHEMQENGARFDKLTDSVAKLQDDVSGLKVKATIAGAVAGLLATGLTSIIFKLWS